MSIKNKNLLIVIIISLTSYSYATSKCKEVFHSKETTPSQKDTFNQLQKLVQEQGYDYRFENFQEIEDLFLQLQKSNITKIRTLDLKLDLKDIMELNKALISLLSHENSSVIQETLKTIEDLNLIELLEKFEENS
ncbi:MAG: hypothetical protein GDA46_04680 [Bdellovibrionales bacterium]|nr:hypothetical protein [Bdellovibrionales bacterium]